MRAAVVDNPAGPAAIETREVPEPVAGADQVLIEVAAVGLGQLDVVCAHGRHQLRSPFPFVPGFEVAGRVRAAPPDARVAVGDRVAAYVDAGGCAELAVADVGLVVPIPDEMPLTEAAALPVNAFTALYALLDRAALQAEELVVVHGAGGGLGMAATRVARLLGATPIAIVSSAERAALARAAGAARVVLTEGDWVAAMRRLLTSRGLEGADVVVDPVGGDRIDQSMRFTRPRGRLVSLGFVAGVPAVRLDRLLVRNLDLIAADWMPSDPVTRQRLAPCLRDHVRELAVPPVATHLAPLVDAADVLGALERRRLAGKAVLHV